MTFADHNAYEFSIKDEKKGQSIQLPDFDDSTHTLFLDNLSAFVIAMKYYRDVICGDRKKSAVLRLIIQTDVSDFPVSWERCL